LKVICLRDEHIAQQNRSSEPPPPLPRLMPGGNSRAPRALHRPCRRRSLTSVVSRSGRRKKSLAVGVDLGNHVPMNRQQIESAVASGIPFTLRMADGQEYTVPHRDFIWLPPNASYVIVHEDDGHFTVLPLLTMTGLRSKVSESGIKEK